jgi:3-hydroxybutyryl-CoA dehydrogenase
MNIGVIGAGTMGRGIAQVSAVAEHRVTLRDIEESILKDSLAAVEDTLHKGIERGVISEEEVSVALERLTTTTEIEEAVAGTDLVIEAVPEDLQVKKEVFAAIEPHAEPETVIASNTSSLPNTEIASVLTRPGRGIGLHFFNPVHVMELVEIVVAAQTSEQAISTAERLVESLDKTPIEVTDSPGFASSRLGVAQAVEAMRMVEEGVASPPDIDRAMELGYNHPLGPLELTDVIGLDVRLDVLEHLHSEIGERFRPPQILKRKARAGVHGKKTGEGFYVWQDGDVVGVSKTGQR